MGKKYSTGLPEVDRQIQEIIQSVDENHPHQELISQMMMTAIKLMRDGAEIGDLKLINTTLKEIRYACKVFEPYREHRKVSIFGSARCKEETLDYQQAKTFARKMKDRNFMCITGAGHGIMAAGNHGAGREHSFGLNIRLPFEQESNCHIEGDDKLINFKYFFTRKLAFVKETHAIACFPGGFGTHDEGYEALTLVQTGKSHLVPIVFVHPKEDPFWDDWLDYNQNRLCRRGMISPEDSALYRVFYDVDKAVDEILYFYRRYHSMRYINDDLLIRMESELMPEQIAILNQEFSDIVKSGEIYACDTQDEETDQDIAHLPRLRFHFVRRSFGRLRLMIDRINGFPLTSAVSYSRPEHGEGGIMPVEIDDENDNV